MKKLSWLIFLLMVITVTNAFGQGDVSNPTFNTVRAKKYYEDGTLISSKYQTAGVGIPKSALVAKGDLLTASNASTPAVITDVAAGSPLLSGGIGQYPAYAAYTLAAPGAIYALMASDGTNWTRLVTSANVQTMLGSATNEDIRNNIGAATRASLKTDNTDGSSGGPTIPVVASDNHIEELTLPGGFALTGTTSPILTVTDRIGASFDGGGSAIALNKITYAYVPFAATVTKWTVICDVDSGANGIIITPYKDAYAEDTLPTTTMCTTGSAPHTSGGATAGGTAHQAAWDCNVTTVEAGSSIAFKVTQAPSSATWCSVTLDLTR
jgi:hypothetical protein